MKKVGWPQNPKELELFVYTDPIGGCDNVYWIFREGKWNQISEQVYYEYMYPRFRY